MNSQPLNIWLIQIGEPLPINNNVRKMRTALLADELNKRGHDVLWWASAFDHLQKDWIFENDADLEVGKNYKIKALKGIGYKKNMNLSRFIDHRIIARKFVRLAPKLPKPDIIIAATPSYDLAYKAVKFANENNIPILVDIRDEWPDIFLEHVPSFLQSLAKRILFTEFSMIKKTMKNADGLISMMDKLLEWGLSYAGRTQSSNDKVFYLGHKKNPKKSLPTNRISKLTQRLKDKFVVTFIGTFGHYNNPSVMVDCAKQLHSDDIHFVLAGDGDNFNEIKKKAANLPNVDLPGWLTQNDIEVLLKHSHVGVCSTTQSRDSFPNKTFVYLSAGLPIISSVQGELKEIIDKQRIGFNYPPGDLKRFLELIKQLQIDRDLYNKMSDAAHEIYNKSFNADKIYEKYAAHIEKLGGKQKLR